MVELVKGYVIPAKSLSLIGDNVKGNEAEAKDWCEWMTNASKYIHFVRSPLKIDGVEECCVVGKILEYKDWHGEPYKLIGRAYEYEGEDHLTECEYKAIDEVAQHIATRAKELGLDIYDKIQFPRLYATDIVD